MLLSNMSLVSPQCMGDFFEDIFEKKKNDRPGDDDDDDDELVMSTRQAAQSLEEYLNNADMEFFICLLTRHNPQLCWRL